MLIWILGIYAVGLVAYWLSGGWFRTLVLGLSCIIAPLFIIFTSFTMSVHGEAVWGIAYLYIFIAPIGLFSSGVFCAGLAHLTYVTKTHKALRMIVISLILIVPPLAFSWVTLVQPDIKRDNKRAYYDNRRMNGVFDFYFDGKKYEFPCHDALFSFHGYSRHGGEDICRLKNEGNSKRQVRKRLYINNRDSGHHYFCDKNGTLERSKSAYCQFKRPSERMNFSLGPTEWSERMLKKHGVPPNNPTSMIGGLELVYESVKKYEPMKRRIDGVIVERRPRTKLMIRKDWPPTPEGIQHKANIICSEGGTHKDLGPYSCSGGLQISDNLAAKLSFRASKVDIETQLDEKRDEIWHYWLYLDENFRVWPAKTSD